ncbi:MAG: hypothetical protein ACLGHN_05180 [Bacteriovoracia bacterium]
MKTILFTFILLITGVAQAATEVPSGVKCMKEARSLGLSIVDSYQTCSVKPRIRSCILKQQKENKALHDKKELKKLGKEAIKNCQE